MLTLLHFPHCRSCLRFWIPLTRDSPVRYLIFLTGSRLAQIPPISPNGIAENHGCLNSARRCAMNYPVSAPCSKIQTNVSAIVSITFLPIWLSESVSPAGATLGVPVAYPCPRLPGGG